MLNYHVIYNRYSKKYLLGFDGMDVTYANRFIYAKRFTSRDEAYDFVYEHQKQLAGHTFIVQEIFDVTHVDR